MIFPWVIGYHISGKLYAGHCKSHKKKVKLTGTKYFLEFGL